jgi:DNA processing protein
MSSKADASDVPPRRTATFSEEPGFYEPASLWLYGNARLLDSRLAYVRRALGPNHHARNELEAIEKEAEEIVLGSGVLVCGVHHAGHQRAAIVPLRWGSPRIVVLSGGFRVHLGENLDQEPFRAARLWRYSFDPATDLVISRRAPDKRPTFATHNPTVDRLIAAIVAGTLPGVLFARNPAMSSISG